MRSSAQGYLPPGRFAELVPGRYEDRIFVGGEDAGHFLLTGFFTMYDGYYELHMLRRNESYRVVFFDFDGVYTYEYYDDQPNFPSADWILMSDAVVGPINASLAAKSMGASERRLELRTDRVAPQANAPPLHR